MSQPQSVPSPRVIAVGPMPPEKCAYALARYSRSADSIRDSIEWVRTHDSSKFLDSFYFQYGHASIADLGHVVLCFEGISELAATEIEDEQLWDGQAKSSRYQDFSKAGVVMPPGLSAEQESEYTRTAETMVASYREVFAASLDDLRTKLPRPAEMKPDAYERNIAARAFDVARYLLPLGIPTNVGQVTSIRTLERQVRRLKASEYEELQSLGVEIGRTCAERPGCVWADGAAEPVAPTLAKYLDADEHAVTSRRAVAAWAEANLPRADPGSQSNASVDLMRPNNTGAEIAATLLYSVTQHPFRWLYEIALSWPEAKRQDLIGAALASRTRRDELQRAFRTGGQYCFDIVMDIGSYRDLHRHRRVQQFRQPYTGDLGYARPDRLAPAGKAAYERGIAAAQSARQVLPDPQFQYALPLATYGRFLFKMDFAEAEYIIRLRSGVKGHFGYREIAYLMHQQLTQAEPELRELLGVTPPSIEDPLTR